MASSTLLPASVSSSSSPWNRLPPELAELILAYLPPTSISKSKSVCRSWHSSISSPHFRSLFQHLHPRILPSLFLYNHSVKISSWSSSDRLWKDLQLPAFYVRDWAGSRGLVCLRCHLLTKGYLVGNPLTGRWTDVPDPVDHSVGKIWAIVTDSSHRDYRIILLHKTSALLQIYSSETNQWTQKSLSESLQTGITTGSNHRASPDCVFSSSATSIGELVYAVVGETRCIVTFDSRRDIWKQLDAGLPSGLIYQIVRPDYLIDTPPKFMEGPKGKILMVGGLLHEEEQFLGVVWELDAARKSWTEVARAPLQMCNEMLEDAKEYRKSTLMPVKYVGDGELIVIMACGSQRAITFNLLDENWNWLDLPSTTNCELTLCF